VTDAIAIPSEFDYTSHEMKINLIRNLAFVVVTASSALVIHRLPVTNTGNECFWEGVLLPTSSVGSGAQLPPKNQTAQHGKFSREDERRERAENLRARLEQELLMLRDPLTKTIPERIFEREQQFSARLPKRGRMLGGSSQPEADAPLVHYSRPAKSGWGVESKVGSATPSQKKGAETQTTQALEWTERGPTNVGGRTRALGIDAMNADIIIAGGVSGGLWKSTNDGATWAMKIQPYQLHNASCLVQDTRSGKTGTWYAGSGEAIGNSASEYGASFRGDGIFKSTDNGESWNLLASTSTNIPQQFDKLFDYVWNVAVDISQGDTDVVYAATYGAIYRSNDGGTSWLKVIGGGDTNNVYTDVQITSTGLVYATLSSEESSTRGFWKSSNGLTWTKITPSTLSTATYYRTVIGIAPLKEHTVYFLTNTQGIGKPGSYSDSSDDHTFLVYNNLTNTWADRSANLPPQSGNVGGYSSQGSYDMFVRVKPNDSAFVIIGGTNLHRSTNGFSTAAGNTSANWIGGYSVANDVSVYTNHHPDQHAGLFRPGSNVIFYSGNDGGVKKSNDVTASTVAWASLNNGYNVTQFYSISLAPESGSNWMMAGAQDNGTNLGTSAGASSWTQVETGDGTIIKIAPVADDRLYTAYQFGGLRHRDRSGLLIYQGIKYDIQPGSAANQLFVNPLAMDPNNSSILYYPAGKVNAAGALTVVSEIWRTSNATVKSPSWTELAGTDIGTRSEYIPRISGLGVSTANTGNVLYYGSSDGVVRKVTNANATPTVSTVTPTSSNTSPSTNLSGGTSSGGYVSCIAVDPTNSDDVLLTFSNYNFQSLWYTTNGGTNWTDVEGNLAGATGPSIRWATIFYVSGTLHVFIGTSVGLYFTTALNGSSTVWTQDGANEIGNVVVPMLDYRSADNTLAVGTHGRGAFTAVISVALPVQMTAFTVTPARLGADLRWATATETNNAGFEVERRLVRGLVLQVGEESNHGPEAWNRIGFITGAGTSNSPHEYSYDDKNLAAGRYAYRLKQIDRSGLFSYSQSAEVEIGIAPREFTLNQNYPNPFNPTTTIEFTLLQDGHATLKVFDVTGREVATLVDEEMRAGMIQRATFNASRFAAGVYFARLESGGKRLLMKMVLVK
jgi:hypothetical protein